MANRFTRTNLTIQDLIARIETYARELTEITELHETEERYNRLSALRNTFRESMVRIVADFDNALQHERSSRA